MATYKVLGQSAPSATTNTDVYTVPGSTSTIISTLTIANRSATVATFRVAVRPSGAAISNAHYIAYDTTITANGIVTMTLGLTLATTDVVTVYASTANVSFGLYGVENP